MAARLPKATVGRLPRYLRVLQELPRGATTVSSDEIAQAAAVTAAQVRKDLAHLNPPGTRGVGYDVNALTELITRTLGLRGALPVIIVGAGNLGSALARYRGFAQRGFRIVAIYDSDPNRIGKKVGSFVIKDVGTLVEDAAESGYAIGIITTPATAAQRVVDLMVEAGIHSILNFAPKIVSVPEGVEVRPVELAAELQILSHHLAHRNVPTV